MQRDRLFAFHQKMSANALDLMRKKNQDYCKLDAFTNLMLCQHMGICTAEEGVIIRLTDKLARMASVLSKGALVKDESVTDTCLDIINYAILLAALREKGDTVEETPKK